MFQKSYSSKNRLIKVKVECQSRWGRPIRQKLICPNPVRNPLVRNPFVRITFFRNLLVRIMFVRNPFVRDQFVQNPLIRIVLINTVLYWYCTCVAFTCQSPDAIMQIWHLDNINVFEREILPLDRSFYMWILMYRKHRWPSQTIVTSEMIISDSFCVSILHKIVSSIRFEQMGFGRTGYGRTGFGRISDQQIFWPMDCGQTGFGDECVLVATIQDLDNWVSDKLGAPV